jgi:hypothetical protein
MTINPEAVQKLISGMLEDLKQANDASKELSTESLLSRCYFVSFFDDLLAETINQMNAPIDPYFSHVTHNQFQKLFDDGGVGQYILSKNQNFTNKTPGDKSGSNTNFKDYAKYTDGS